MPKISLTDFVDVVSKSGTPKATKVAQIKNRSEYDPRADFYKKVRDSIIKTHKTNGSKNDLKRMLEELSDEKKLKNYPGIVSGYLKWWGRKTFRWFVPPTSVFSKHGVEVSINPELGLELNGKQHVIKLYFKGEALTKNRIDIVTHLMETCLRKNVSQVTTMSVLDIRNARLISPNVPIPKLNAALNAELAYIAEIWPNV